MPIDFYAEDVDLPQFSIERIESVYQRILSDANKELDFINVIFCSDEYLLKVNIDYLQHDYYTDIITFDYSDEVVSSDIFISVDRIKDNANEFNTSFDNELSRILIHGVLHLVGYKDKEPEAKTKMTEMEDYYLKILSEL